MRLIGLVVAVGMTLVLPATAAQPTRVIGFL
jgi:hypothetical protein